MTTDHHTPIDTGANADADVINSPLEQLDDAITIDGIWDATGDDIYYSTGNVGIGAGFPSESISGPLEIHDGVNQLLLLDSGGDLDIAGGLTEHSDVNAKKSFSPVDNKEILASLVKIPITTWSFKRKPTVRHMGPTAQDFHAAFGLGRDNRHIVSLDTNGVAIAAIQALYQMAQEEDSQVIQLQEQNTALEMRLKKLEEIVKSS